MSPKALALPSRAISQLLARARYSWAPSDRSSVAISGVFSHSARPSGVSPPSRRLTSAPRPASSLQAEEQDARPRALPYMVASTHSYSCQNAILLQPHRQEVSMRQDQ